MIVSNPPYVAEGNATRSNHKSVTGKPPEALFSGIDGMDAIVEIVRGAPEWLQQERSTCNGDRTAAS